LLCKELELFGGELIAIDGSKFKAWNNRKRNWNDEKLQRALQEIDEKISIYVRAPRLSHMCQSPTPRAASAKAYSRKKTFATIHPTIRSPVQTTPS